MDNYLKCRYIESGFAWAEVAPDLWVKIGFPVEVTMKFNEEFWLNMQTEHVIQLGRVSRFFTIEQIDELLNILGLPDVAMEMYTG